MPDEEEFDDEQDDEEQTVAPAPRPTFSLPSFGQGEQAPSPQEPEAERKPRTDDTALDDEDEEEIFGIGERSDGSVDELERTDLDDVFDVSESDITGEKSRPKQRFSRTTKKFRPSNLPNTTLGGMQY